MLLLLMEGLQSWVIGVVFCVVVVEGFWVLWVKWCFFLQVSYQIWVGDVIVVKGYGINQFFIDKIVGFFYCVSVSVNDYFWEVVVDFLMESFIVRFVVCLVWFGYVQIGDIVFCQFVNQIQCVFFFVWVIIYILEVVNW